MAEVGLVPFAHLAPEVAATVLPPYRTRFSKHQFTQPQLLAVLCLMRLAASPKASSIVPGSSRRRKRYNVV